MATRNRRGEGRGLNAFRGLTPAAGARSTYQTPTVVYGPDNDMLQIARALGGLSPSLQAFADRAVTAQRQQEDVQADEISSQLTADEARAASMKEWRELEEQNPALKGASPYLQMSLRTSLGRRVARSTYRQQLDEARASFTDPMSDADPEAYLVQSGNEFMDGMGYFARAAFATEKQSIDDRWLQQVDQERRTRRIDERFRATRAELADVIESGMSDGATLDLDEMARVLTEHHAVTSDGGSDSLLAALTASATNAIRNADSPADALEDALAVLVQADNVKDGSGRRFGDLYEAELEDLQADLEAVARATFNARVNEEATKRAALQPQRSNLLAQAVAEDWDTDQLAQALGQMYSGSGVEATVYADLAEYDERKSRSESLVKDDPPMYRALAERESAGVLTPEEVAAAEDAGLLSRNTAKRLYTSALENAATAETMGSVDSEIGRVLDGFLKEEQFQYAPDGHRARLIQLRDGLAVEVRQGLADALRESGITDKAGRATFARDWLNTKGMELSRQRREENSELINQFANSTAAAENLLLTDRVIRPTWDQISRDIVTAIPAELGLDPEFLDSSQMAQVRDLSRLAEDYVREKFAAYLDETPGRDMATRHSDLLGPNGLFRLWQEDAMRQIRGESTTGRLDEDLSDLQVRARELRGGDEPVAGDGEQAQLEAPKTRLTPRTVRRAVSVMADSWNAYTDGDVAADPEAFAARQAEFIELSDEAFATISRQLSSDLVATDTGFRTVREAFGPDVNRPEANLTASAIWLKQMRGVSLRELTDKRLYFADTKGGEHSFAVDPARFNPRTTLLYLGPDEFNAATEADHRARLEQIPVKYRPDSIQDFVAMQRSLLVKTYPGQTD